MKSSIYITIFVLALSVGARADTGPKRGTASWYHECTHTATGARYNPQGLTAAHRTLPFGTKVKVTNLRNQRSVTVVINDRGPFRKGRIIDVSRGAAMELQMMQSGLAQVEITPLER